MFQDEMNDELEIEGDWPALENGMLEELLCSEMCHQGKIEEPANVIYLKVNGHWHRLYFDYGIIFWRKDTEGPKEYEMPECESHFKVVDIGRKYDLINKIIESVAGHALPKGSQVIFRLTDEKTITFSNIEDNTTYKT